MKYVPEGDTDLKSQSAKEEALQGAISTEHKKKVRKTLRDQLRANAIKKHKETFKPRPSRNIAKEDMQFIKALDKQRHEEAQRVLQLSADQEYEYEKKRAKISTSTTSQQPPQELPKVSSGKLKLKVKRTKLVRKKVTRDDLT